MHQSHGDVEFALGAPGVGLGDFVRHLVQPEAAEQGLHALLQVLSGHLVEVALQLQVLAPRGLYVDGGLLGHDADGASNPTRMQKHVDACHLGPAGVRTGEGG